MKRERYDIITSVVIVILLHYSKSSLITILDNKISLPAVLPQWARHELSCMELLKTATETCGMSLFIATRLWFFFFFLFTFCNCCKPSSVLTQACSTLKSILSRTVPWSGRNTTKAWAFTCSNKSVCYDNTCIKGPLWYLFHHHPSQISEDLIQVGDGLDYLPDLSFPLLHHDSVLLHQHQLVICESLKHKEDRKLSRALWLITAGLLLAQQSSATVWWLSEKLSPNNVIPLGLNVKVLREQKKKQTWSLITF